MSPRRAGFTIVELIVVIAIVAVLLGMLLPAIERVRNVERRSRSSNNLRQIGKAMGVYDLVNHGLPSAAHRDRSGVPLLSWRVELPFIESASNERFRLNEPWDSEHNRSLLPNIYDVYRPLDGRSGKSTNTYYQVFVGPQTAFERAGLGRWARYWNEQSDFPDGASYTFLVVEAGRAVPWTKPAEIEYAPDGPLPELGGTIPRPTQHLLGLRAKRLSRRHGRPLGALVRPENK